MTPAECRPGTVVQWGQYVGVVEGSSIAETAAVMGGITKPGEYIGVRSDAGHHLVAPAELELAPRFLVGSEWLVVAEQAQGSVWFANGRWEWSAVTPEVELVTGSAPTYLAARQAVERACGVERTE